MSAHVPTCCATCSPIYAHTTLTYFKFKLKVHFYTGWCHNRSRYRR